MMILIWIGVVLLIAWALKNFGVNGCCGSMSRDGRRHQEKTPLDILKERYAKGEIDKKEFDEKRKGLEK